MNTIAAVSCTRCGGAVRAAPGRELPACLFCGAEATDLVAVDAEIESPVGAGPFVRTPAQAREAFRSFARSSFFYPSDLRNTELELRALLVAAWSFSGEVETHYTGLVTAATVSGKAPVAGRATERFVNVLVPGSATLTLAEIRALGAFRSALEPFDPDTTEVPFEVSTTTREGARSAARGELAARHAEAIARRERLLQIHSSASIQDLTGDPVLVPVYVGVYHYRDVPWRFLVNGQTGRTHGEAPISAAKVAAVVAAVVLLVATVIFLAMVLR